MASFELADPDPCVFVLRFLCEGCSFCSGIFFRRLQSSICETKLCHKLCEAENLDWRRRTSGGRRSAPVKTFRETVDIIS
jgi:hypothetical protein